MGLFEFLTGSNNGYAENLERSLAGISLRTKQSYFENDPDWQELNGPEKAIFQSGIPNEKIYVSYGHDLVICGCVLNQVYKVAYVVKTSDGYTRLSGLKQQYGKPSKRGRFQTWENEMISLDVSVGPDQINLILTDRQLLTDIYKQSLK